MKIITNNVPRLVIDDYQLTDKERKEFDYIDWKAIEQGNDSASFFRYQGRLYDLHEFETTITNPQFKGWDGYSSDSFFSGVLVKYADDDHVIVGTYIS